jgi:cell wall-associated NlpC family hydrolase
MTSGYPWARRISYSEAKPGDLILSNAPGHVGMLLADGYWVHTNRTGDISHVTVAPTSPDLSLTVEPDKA